MRGQQRHIYMRVRKNNAAAAAYVNPAPQTKEQHNHTAVAQERPAAIRFQEGAYSFLPGTSVLRRHSINKRSTAVPLVWPVLKLAACRCNSITTISPLPEHKLCFFVKKGATRIRTAVRQTGKARHPRHQLNKPAISCRRTKTLQVRRNFKTSQDRARREYDRARRRGHVPRAAAPHALRPARAQQPVSGGLGRPSADGAPRP